MNMEAIKNGILTWIKFQSEDGSIERSLQRVIDHGDPDFDRVYGEVALVLREVLDEHGGN